MSNPVLYETFLMSLLEVPKVIKIFYYQLQYVQYSVCIQTTKFSLTDCSASRKIFYYYISIIH